MSALAKRLIQARKQAELTQVTLAEAINSAQSTVASWERGTNEPDLGTIEKIARKTSTDPAWLAFGRAQSSAVIDGNRYISIPIYDIAASAGAGAIADDETPLGFRLFESDWLRNITRTSPNRLAVIRVTGDSMWETLHSGDHVLIDMEQRNLAREGIYVVGLEGQLLVKRISMHPKTKLLTLSSDNPKYPAYGDLSADDISIIGRVMWLGRNVV
jgi:phage repressor protein C with HTH and peptisase S24 domain